VGRVNEATRKLGGSWVRATEQGQSHWRIQKYPPERISLGDGEAFDLTRPEWRKRRNRMTSRGKGSEVQMNITEAARRAKEFAKDQWDRAEVTDKYEDADYFVIRGVFPSGQWTIMFDKRSGKRVIPP
jgi:hypothetical protein